MATLRLPALVLWIVAACATAGKTEQNVQNDGPTDDSSLTVDANNCVNQPCDILTQCGCASDAACDIDDEDLDGGACRMVAPTAVGEGAACSNAGGCQGGNVCLGNPGVCKKYCDADADCGQPRGQCLLEINANGTPIPNIPKACSSGCDPTNVGAGGCPAGRKCGLFNTGMPTNLNFVDCAGAGAGVQGTVCGPAPGNDALCGPNFLCTTVGAAIACRRICVVGGAGICAGAAPTCIAFNPAFNLAGVQYGVCN